MLGSRRLDPFPTETAELSVNARIICLLFEFPFFYISLLFLLRLAESGYSGRYEALGIQKFSWVFLSSRFAGMFEDRGEYRLLKSEINLLLNTIACILTKNSVC